MNIIDSDINVEKLVNKVDFLDGAVWNCEPISVDQIKKTMDAGPKCVPPFNEIKDSSEPEGGWRQYHIQRIAFLALSEIDDTLEGDWPIKISVGQDPEEVTIEEGRHRVCAAQIRKKSTLQVRVFEIADGDFNAIFGNV